MATAKPLQNKLIKKHNPVLGLLFFLFVCFARVLLCTCWLRVKVGVVGVVGEVGGLAAGPLHAAVHHL